MKFAFHMRQPFTKTVTMAHAIREGALKHGDEVRIYEGFEKPHDDIDGLIIFGIGGNSKETWNAYEGKHRILIDKGYTRTPYYRVAINDFQPLAYLDRIKRSTNRLVSCGAQFEKYRKHGKAILFDGASNKYCQWLELGDWIEWGAGVVQKIRQHTDRPIIYRPRPSHNEAIPVLGAELSTGPLADDFARAAVVVSYGGNIGWDAALAGIPHFAIGDSIARPISETNWDNLDTPFKPTSREQWAANVTYCQWTPEEFRSGLAWAEIRQEIINQEQ